MTNAKEKTLKMNNQQTQLSAQCATLQPAVNRSIRRSLLLTAFLTVLSFPLANSFGQGIAKTLILAPPNPHVTITVHPESQTKNAKIFLREIAEFTTSSTLLTRQLNELELDDLPQFGKPFSISASWLNAKLRLAGIDIKRVTLQCPPKATIMRIGRQLPVAEVQAAVEQALLERLSAPAQALVFRNFRPLSKPLIPYGEASYTVDANLNVQRLGVTRFSITVEVPGQPATELNATATVDLRIAMPTVKQAIARGELIEADDLQYTTTLFSKAPRDAVQNATYLVGMTARANLALGQFFKTSQVQQPLLVRRNEEVIIVLQKGALKITTKGVSLKDGSKDEIIQVRNSRSNRIVTARVVDKQYVQVLF